MVRVESLDQEGRGVAHRDGKTIFIEEALPGETVTFTPFRKKPAYELATLDGVVRASFSRVTPRCAYFGVCGGCSVQHLEPRAQVAAKQRLLEDTLWHIGKVRPALILPAICGPEWGYRQRARFAVRYLPKKGGALVGFHEKRSSHVADMASCEIVPPRISALLGPLRELIGGLSVRNRIPQVEVAAGDALDVLVLRILAPLTGADEASLRVFAERHQVHLYLQPGGPETAHLFHPQDGTEPSYHLPEYDVTIRFGPTEFTQVNSAVNRVLVRRAVSLLAPLPGERIADAFCGVGNFALALARCGASVVGLEGSEQLVRRAADNARLNGLRCTEFVVQDLFRVDADALRRLGHFDKLLIDPPREGAVELAKSLDEQNSPQRIVYVSCNPATLARDAAVLVHVKGYRLAAAGVVNMFPHTSHVESIAVFDRDG
ncbi:MAG: 23S rRNA (uracil(1939)-C(5))-methyltransferase RlmD [Betaproteobacteria bacterium]|nr:23S rRNA (uracil(1939)-C(5))-methyltransferase RlmD [Betaproteobacteria bacterium]